MFRSRGEQHGTTEHSTIWLQPLEDNIWQVILRFATDAWITTCMYNNVDGTSFFCHGHTWCFQCGFADDMNPLSRDDWQHSQGCQDCHSVRSLAVVSKMFASIINETYDEAHKRELRRFVGISAHATVSTRESIGAAVATEQRRM